MKKETMRKLTKIGMTLCVIAGMLSLAILVPQVREIIIGFGEKMDGRPYLHKPWHEFLIGLEFLFLVVIFMLLKTLAFISRQYTDVHTLFKSKLQKITDDEWLHYITLTAFIFTLCLLHFCFAPSGDDVNYFNHALQGTSYINFLKSRYDGWSSRLIIETVLVKCYALNFGLWRFLDIVAFVVIAESLVYICMPQKKCAVFVYAIILLLTDWRSLQSAGWGATTVNYLWPLAASMPAFVVIKKIFSGTSISKKEMTVSFLLLFFATNHEQIVAWLFGLNLSFLIYRIVKNRRIDKNDFYIIASLLLCLLSLVFILTCPGNKIRSAAETNTWFPQYTSLSFFEKLQLGVLTIFTYYFSLRVNFVIVPLCIILTIVLRTKNKMLFVLQVFLDALILLNFVLWILSKGKWLFSNNKLYQFTNFSKIAVLCECVILVIIGIVFLYQIMASSGTVRRGLYNAFLLIAGFCSAFIIAFSPTVYASGSRCYLFLSYTIFFVTFNLISDYLSNKRSNLKL